MAKTSSRFGVDDTMLQIGVILNADDCAVIGRDKTAGRRGLAGLVLLLKVMLKLVKASVSLFFYNLVIRCNLIFVVSGHGRHGRGWEKFR